MKKETRNKIIVGSIILLLLLLVIKVPYEQTVITGAGTTSGSGWSSGGSSGGGASGGTTSSTSTTDTPLLFVPLKLFFPTFENPIIIPTIFPTTTSSLSADGSSCTSNSQCQSNYCYLGNMAVGKCTTPSRDTDTSTIDTSIRTTTDTTTSRDILFNSFSCSDYAADNGYRAYYSGELGAQETCDDRAKLECDYISRDYRTYQTTRYNCCVWTC